jgi:hypothetical protein
MKLSTNLTQAQLRDFPPQYLVFGRDGRLYLDVPMDITQEQLMQFPPKYLVCGRHGELRLDGLGMIWPPANAAPPSDAFRKLIDQSRAIGRRQAQAAPTSDAVRKLTDQAKARAGR